MAPLSPAWARKAQVQAPSDAPQGKACAEAQEAEVPSQTRSGFALVNGSQVCSWLVGVQACASVKLGIDYYVVPAFHPRVTSIRR